jgi:hypothetical protein
VGHERNETKRIAVKITEKDNKENKRQRAFLYLPRGNTQQIEKIHNCSITKRRALSSGI